MFKKSQKDIKNEMIQKAGSEEKYRKPIPQGNHTWDQDNFIDFSVIQRNQKIKLHTYRCLTSNNIQPQSVTVFFHGLNEHLGLYAHIAQAVSKQANSVTVGFDFRGFGKSEGLRGWLESKEQLIDDCIKFIQLIKQLYPGIQLFALGQSLGGLASYLMAQRNMCDGTILITPALMDNYYNRPYLKRVALILGSFIQTWTPFSASYVNGSKNPQVLEENMKDPYINWNATLPGTGRNLIKMMREMPETFSTYTSPFLVISGGMDQIIDPDVGHELMRLSPSQDKQLIYYENMWHDCISEEEIIEIIPQIIKWILERSK